MAFVKSWSEGSPTDMTDAFNIDNEIRDIKTALRERLAVDHDFVVDETGVTTIGKHKQGSARVGVGTIGTRPVSDPDNPGSVYFATNENYELTVDNGTEWKSPILKYLKAMYPIGSVYINAGVATNPNTLFGFGTWVSLGAGKTLVSLDSADPDFDTLGETGGAKTHTLIPEEMPSHTHTEQSVASAGLYLGGLFSGYSTRTTSIYTRNAGLTGGDQAHNNLQPYLVVYMWKRTG